ncbi:LCP family protein [Saccharopolyspora sp. MS10]|uniref:LCP family protein n=1 Tax=Saccharopolyspora sp. MS10 TaxID=3385973 RepID=UPI0039A33681
MADEQLPPDRADARAPESAAARPPRGRRLLRIGGRALLALLSACALAVTAAGWTALDQLSGEVSSSEVLVEEPPDAPRADDGATDVLLVGSDSRTDARGEPLPLDVLRALRTESTSGLNTDTLILLRVPHDGARPTAVSLPRDTSVPVPGGGTQKINAVYGLAKAAAGRRGADEAAARLAGQRALVRSAQDLAGVRVDHYAEVNLLGFYEVTEALGGVEVCLRQATSDKDSGADFAAGRQTVSGGDALAFVRQRHGLPRGDLDRIVRQQVFLAAVTHELLSTGTLTDPAKLAELRDAAGRSVVLDRSWDIAGFAARMEDLASGGVRFVTLPVRSTAARDEHGQSVVAVDRAEVREFVAGLVHPSGFSGGGAVALDGGARRAAPAPRNPITSDGIPCVN